MDLRDERRSINFEDRTPKNSAIAFVESIRQALGLGKYGYKAQVAQDFKQLELERVRRASVEEIIIRHMEQMRQEEPDRFKHLYGQNAKGPVDYDIDAMVDKLILDTKVATNRPIVWDSPPKKRSK